MPHPYGAEYRRRREAVLGQPCIWCGAAADTGEHWPPLETASDGDWTGDILPACRRCNYGRRANKLFRPPAPGEVSELMPRRRKVLA